MEDQALNGTAGGGGATSQVDDLARREPSAKPGLKQQAKDSVRDAREQVMTEVRDRKDQAKESATRMVDERKHTLSESMSALASAFDAAASSLGEENQQRLAEWTREFSGRARRISSYLEQNDTRGLVNDLEDTARENPTAFVGTSFAAGLAAGRFLRASARDGAEAAGGYSTSAPRLSDDGVGERGGGYGNPGTGFGTTGSSLHATRSGFGDAGFGPTRTSGPEGDGGFTDDGREGGAS